MTSNRDSDLWELVRQGKHALIIGVPSISPPDAWSAPILRVVCRDVPEVLGAVNEARRLVRAALNEPPTDADRERIELELRWRLLSDAPDTAAREALVDDCNRLAQRFPGTVLVFEGADAADPASLALLARAIRTPGRLRTPAVFTFATRTPTGPAAQLLEAIRTASGIVAERAPDNDADRGAARAEPQRWRELPADVVRVLRSAAMLGREFDARQLANRLGIDVHYVLQRLQTAFDGGVLLEDDGNMMFRMPDGLRDALLRTLLPSLAHAFEASALEAPNARVEHGGSTAIGAGLGRANGIARNGALANGSHETARAIPAPRVYERAPNPTTRETARVDTQRREAPTIRMGRLQEQEDGAAARELASARATAELGAYGQAMGMARKALARLGGGPHPAPARLLRVRILSEIGRLHWLGSGPEYEFSLSAALEALAEAHASLTPDDPVALRAHVAVLLATVCYDVGDLTSLERALALLAQTSRELLTAGDAYGAARLLNDQAAVYVRMGDPVQAVHLLEQARRVFEERADTEPTALAEVAATDHLLARIPLHAPPRPGKAEAAIASALEHAARAEGAYRRLRDSRMLARVWETSGRLELRAGHPDRAAELITRAMQAQAGGGDAIGLARSTAALADVLEAGGRSREALELLGESVSLNMAKGSPLGLAFNRRTLQTLSTHAADAGTSSEELAVVAERLAAAEAALGRVELPSENA